MSTDPDTRRAIAQRAIDRANAHGTPMDQDPAFADLLEEWISGRIEMRELRERYLDMLALREAERRGRYMSQNTRRSNQE